MNPTNKSPKLNLASLLLTAAALTLIPLTLPSCSSLTSLTDKLAGYDTAALIDLFAKSPSAQEYDYHGKIVKLLSLLKKDGTTEVVAVTEEGEVVDKEAVIADAAK